MTLTYIEKKIFEIEILEPFSFGTLPVRTLPPLRLGLQPIWASHLIAEVPKVFPRAGDFFVQFTVFDTIYRFRDIGMQRSPLILGAARKFAMFWLPLQRRLIR